MGSTQLHPVLFVGHGSPMNALGGNAYSAYLNQLGPTLPAPKAILAISAHWETLGTQVLDREPPPTIYDFQGFPPELYKITYPAHGAPELVASVERLLGPAVTRSKTWGLDHGTWAVLHHLYPHANIPVTQLSLNRSLSFAEHFQLGMKLKPLREQGYLIMASGNIVHNLREINWRDSAAWLPWAVEFDDAIREALLNRDFAKLQNFNGIDEATVRKSVPTPEHYIPLLYAAGASDAGDMISFPFAEIQNGSISMRSVRFGGI
ncbi:MAG: 4,5-DOPA-extradiol-dioxygenase [Bdellovibrionales bacterium]